MPNPEDFPLVSAILLAGRVSLADIRRCVDCFHSQTYPNKELIIVQNGTLLEIPDDPDIIPVDIPVEVTAGMARNKGIAIARGQILAQFDADYWHAPSRLSAQIATMANAEANISMLTSTLQYSFISGRARIFRNKQNAVLNTMVWARPAKAEYPNISHSEEVGLLHVLMQMGMQPITIDRPELCCKLILTNGERQLTPISEGLTDEQFTLITACLGVG